MRNAMSIRLLLSYLIISALLPISAQLQARESLLFTCAKDTTEGPSFSYYRNLYERAFDNIGYDFSIVSEPDMRALTMAATGQSDGICVRPSAYMEQFGIADLIKVKVLIAEADMQIWSHNKDLLITRQTPLSSIGRVASFRRGNYWAKQYLADQEGIIHFDVTTSSTGLKLLAAQRIDFFIGFEPIIGSILSDELLEGKIYAVGTLHRVKLYPYLHKKHSNLIPALELQLKELLKQKPSETL